MHASNAIFHFCTLEEYYVGGLFLPFGNPISDGSLLYFITMAVPAIMGNDIFVAECFAANFFYEGSPRLTAVDLIIPFSVTVQTFTVIASIRKIIEHKKKIRAAEHDDDYHAAKPMVDGEELECSSLASQVFAYFFLQGSLQCLAFIGPEPIISHDGKKGELSQLFLLTLMQSFLMQHLTTEVMLAHITK